MKWVFLLIPTMFFGQFNPVAFYEYGKQRSETQFAFSTYQIVSSSTTPAQIKNSALSTTDVGFSSGIINTSAITTFAAGADAKMSRLYDQTGKNGYLSIDQGTGTLNPEPFCTDVSFNGVNYWRDTAQNTGLYKTGDLPLKMNNDYIVNYVLRNETNVNTQRINYLIRTDMSGHEGISSLCIRSLGGTSYIAYIKYVYANRNLQAADVSYTFTASTTLFSLLTFSHIQGVLKFYVNGTLQTSTTTNADTGGINTKGIIIGVGSSDMVSFPVNPSVYGGKVNDFKTLTLLTGKNLSSFDITTYMNTFKTIHGI